MTMPLCHRLRLLATVGLCALFVPPAAAQDFYSGKTITILVGSAPGGSYDLYARAVARHIGKYIPGDPTAIVKNMPGAASMTMGNHIYEIAPKDGTTLGAPLNTLPLTQLLNPEKFAWNAAEFNWIGAVSSPANVLATWHTSGVKTIEDARQKEVVIGATTPGTTQEMYPLLANNLFGTKFKVITGYKASADINIAMERGEVQGRGANTYIAYRFQNPDWIRDKKINFIFQMTDERDPEMKDVPTLLELAKTDEQRKIISLIVTTETVGRSYFAPPGVPAERVALLRQALMAVVKDPEFIADLEKAKLEISPTSGEKLQAKIQDLAATPPDIVEKYKQAVSRQTSAP
jgi:tripartite-type tricarboxylate transporter receptor subunit TctC